MIQEIIEAPVSTGTDYAQMYGPGKLIEREVELPALRCGRPVRKLEALWQLEESGRGMVPVASRPLN